MLKTDLQTQKELSFKILRILSLSPILMWPLTFYGSLFLFGGPGAVENPLFSYFLFFAVNAYPLFLLGNLYLSNKLYSKNKIISYSLLIWPIGAMVIFLIMILT